MVSRKTWVSKTGTWVVVSLVLLLFDFAFLRIKPPPKSNFITVSGFKDLRVIGGSDTLGIGVSADSVSKSVVLLLRKFTLEMTLNVVSAKRISCFCQHDRIDNLIPFNLRGDKCPIIGQFLVDELYFSAVFNRFDPLFIWHVLSAGCSSRRLFHAESL